MKVRREFNSRAEAEAFREGVEYVNDSAVEVLVVRRKGRIWQVIMEDTDAMPATPKYCVETIDVQLRAKAQQDHVRAKIDATERRDAK